ncbi:uncharacterized protein LOC131243319 [Magnolia sinica]|uniref:uncharacterized protein LOC131243319 n=1 Tax=Magnolia sinica TaxID=86752 RepID=UPI00265A3E85|nr:uncharacterized protein LOC131243319 [Magnolia sinica]
MGKKLVEKKKKKKGRPSLLDLQKRSLRLQQQQHHPPKSQKPNPNTNPNPNPNPYLRFPNPNPSRRSTRRNPSGLDGEEDDEEDEDDDDSNGKKRREKKLKLVLRLPPRPSPSLNSRGGGGSDDGSDSDGDTPLKKRKIDDVGGSEPEDRDLNDGSVWEKAERNSSVPKAMDQSPGVPRDSGSPMPLPDKKLLVFILDRLQKKDTYGVFSDPVDPNELPDYHEVIEHPMDFSTVRKKLASGAYANLEQFEKDVLLICSNAMRYNAPDTIYFRQARSMQELAKKDFENLRQESDDNEPEIKSVRRGRPPGKNSIKRMMGRFPIDRAGSDFSSDATLATAGDNAVWSNSVTRKSTLSDKLGIAEVSARTSHGSRNGDTYGWSADHKSERNDDFPGSVLKGMSKFAKNKFVFDEDRRNTYKQSHQLVSRRESSVLTTFDGEKKQLMAVGVHMEHAYARSLARFAANLGPVAWKVASRKIEKVLPAGVKFGPGWVGENDVPQPREPLISACPPRLPPPPPPPPLPAFQPPSQSRTTTGNVLPRKLESRGDKSSEKQEPLNNSALEGHSNRTIPPSTAATPALPNRSSGPMDNSQAIRGMNYEGGFGLLSNSGMIRPNPPFQIHQNPAIQSTVNGLNSGFGFNLQTQVGKMVRPARPAGNSGNHQMPMMPPNRSEVENLKVSGSSTSINSRAPLPNSCHEVQTGVGSRRGLSLKTKPDSVPPDLNVRFQSPGSPASSVLVDSQQPDLALQL